MDCEDFTGGYSTNQYQSEYQQQNMNAFQNSNGQFGFGNQQFHQNQNHQQIYVQNGFGNIDQQQQQYDSNQQFNQSNQMLNQNFPQFGQFAISNSNCFSNPQNFGTNNCQNDLQIFENGGNLTTTSNGMNSQANSLNLNNQADPNQLPVQIVNRSYGLRRNRPQQFVKANQLLNEDPNENNDEEYNGNNSSNGSPYNGGNNEWEDIEEDECIWATEETDPGKKILFKKKLNFRRNCIRLISSNQ